MMDPQAKHTFAASDLTMSKDKVMRDGKFVDIIEDDPQQGGLVDPTETDTPKLSDDELALVANALVAYREDAIKFLDEAEDEWTRQMWTETRDKIDALLEKVG